MLSQLETQLALNRAAQSYDSLEEVTEWFASLDEDHRRETLVLLWEMAKQAGWRVDRRVNDTAAALAESPVPASGAARRVLSGRPTDSMLTRLVRSPGSAHLDLFSIMITILSIADERRRATKCLGSCTHWWHQDLNDPDLLNRVRAEARIQQDSIDRVYGRHDTSA